MEKHLILLVLAGLLLPLSCSGDSGQDGGTSHAGAERPWTEPTRKIPEGWTWHTHGWIRFAGPADLEDMPAVGHRGMVGHLRDEHFDIRWEYGNPEGDTLKRFFGIEPVSVETLELDGERGELRRYTRTTARGYPDMWMAYFDVLRTVPERPDGPPGLSFQVAFSDPSDEEQARNILETLELR